MLTTKNQPIRLPTSGKPHLKVDEPEKCPKTLRRKNYHIGAPTPITPTLGYRQASTPSVANRQLSVLKFETNVINLADRFILEEKFSRSCFMISRIFSSGPDRLNSSLKNGLQVNDQVHDPAAGIMEQQRNHSFAF
jgi:hypothetical protein